jgi:diguanylate cyclase (GGDEF)-like protein
MSARRRPDAPPSSTTASPLGALRFQDEIHDAAAGVDGFVDGRGIPTGQAAVRPDRCMVVNVPRECRARQPRLAAALGAAVCLLGAILSTYSLLTYPTTLDALYLALMAAVIVILVGASWCLLRGSPGMRDVVLLVVPVVGVAGVLAMNLKSHDSSAAAQISLTFPTLFTASQMRVGAAVMTAAAAIAAEAIVVLSMKPFEVALTDALHVSASVVITTILLVVNGNRQESMFATLQDQAAELERQATVDSLTGLVARRVLVDAARSALTTGTQDHGSALILIDVDHFKNINDGYGHVVGDEVLIHIAGILSSRSRSDTVVSRLGGDEIALLLPDCHADAALRRAEELRAAVRESPLLLKDGRTIPLSISVGVAHAAGDGWDLEVLYQHADESLYDAKRNGRGRVGRLAVVG